MCEKEWQINQKIDHYPGKPNSVKSQIFHHIVIVVDIVLVVVIVVMDRRRRCCV